MGNDLHVVVNGVGNAIKITVHSQIKLILLIESLNNQVSLRDQLRRWVYTIRVHALNVNQAQNRVPDTHEDTSFNCLKIL